MKTPSLLLGAALVLWGWQTGLLPLAVIMAIVLEGSRLVKSRLDLSPSDFNRISDLSTLVFLGMFIYAYGSHRSARAILVLLQWLPMTFLPLLAAQVYSTSERIDISALFLVFRRKKAKKENDHPTAIDLTYPYFGLCILSASAANVRTPWFYVGLFTLSIWALWFYRSRRSSPILWGTLLVVAGFFGYLGQMGLHNLQNIVEKKTLGWFIDFTSKDEDPYRSRTAIGDMVSLKLSDRILFRVRPASRQEHPLLLREASYNAYKSSMWFASQARFERVGPGADGMTWELRPGPVAERIISVTAPFRRGRGMLKLPKGTCEIAHLPVLKMSRNQFGAVKVEEGPGLMTYQVRFDPRTSLDGPPDEADLIVPQKEMSAISVIVQELGLSSKSPQGVLERVAAFFQKNFEYSLALDKGYTDTTPLGNFLLRSRSGHCEYFATATVLLLRAAGIPARYATGYSVQEFSGLEKQFIVRARHAHSWALVYMDGAWHDFDTTPSSWSRIGEDAASLLEPLYDLWSWCMFKFSQWRWTEGEEGITRHIWWLLIPLILLLARRLYSRRLMRRPESGQEDKRRDELKPGLDSEFYLVEKRLTELGYVRDPWETLSSWIRRIEESQSPLVSAESLQSILALHYRYRFDPECITADEKVALRSRVQSWLEQYKETKDPVPADNSIV